jgi:hypothetical protein
MRLCQMSCSIWPSNLKNLPVDVEHVLAAIVLAARHGELDDQGPAEAVAAVPYVEADYWWLRRFVSHAKFFYCRKAGSCRCKFP